MSNIENDKEIKTLLKQAVASVKDTELRRDLWPQMLRKLDERPSPVTEVRDATGVAEQSFKTRKEFMKPRNAFTNTEGMPKIAFRSDIAEEEKNAGPSPAEIRQRAFEIHIERGGIHGCDLDDWLQAERELQEKYKSNEKGTKKN